DGSVGARVHERGAALAGVVEPGRVPAVAGVRKLELVVCDVQRAGDELLPAALVAGDDAGHGLLPCPRALDRHRHELADPQPLAAWLVGDADRDAADAEQPALLPGPREVEERISAAPARVDVGESGVLLGARGVGDVDEMTPGRAGLVVVVARRERDRQAVERDLAGVTGVDLPGQDAEALAEGRSAA